MSEARYRQSLYKVLRVLCANYQNDIAARICTIFGAKWMHPQERGMRAYEEMTETIQCLKISREDAHKIVDSVYDRPVDEDIRKEIGGTFAMLLSICASLELNLADCLKIDEDIVMQPAKQEKMRSRQHEKLHPEGLLDGYLYAKQ